jgi:transcriptional regulator with XRE-family HTH domain
MTAGERTVGGYVTSPNERELAELAFAALDSGDAPSQLRWPAVASRLRKARQQQALTHAQVAERAGVTSGSYYDAESRNDETFTVLSISDIVRLGRLLKVSLGELLFGRTDPAKQKVTFTEIADRLRDRIAASGLSVEEFGEKIGWEVNDVLSNPEALWDFNLVGLRDVSKAVDVDWVATLPDQHSSPPSRSSGC